MTVNSKDDLHRLQLQLAALDSLELAFLYVDQAGSPAFLSSRAAQILLIRDRSDLERHGETLAPLLHSASVFLAGHSRRQPETFSRPRYDEIKLQTTDGRPVPVLAYACNFEVPVLGRTLRESAGIAVIFYDLSAFEPFFKTLEESRKARALVALAASSLGRPLALAPDEKAFSDAMAQGSSAESGGASERIAASHSTCDIARGLTDAVDIVDPLIHGTHRIVVESGTPVLAAVGRHDFLRLVTLLLLEAVEFSGPFGRTRLKPFVGREGRGTNSNALEVQVLILSHRQSGGSEGGPLEDYLHRRYLPTDYRVAVRDEEENSESVSKEVDEFIARSVAREDVTAHAGGVIIPESSQSENARLAAAFAKRMGADLQMKLLNAKMLAISVRLPLSHI